MEHQQGTLRDLLTVLFKHRGKVLVAFLGVVAIVTALTFLLPPSYEAKSSLLVRFGREYVYRPEIGTTPEISMLQNQEELVNSEVQILNNREMIERVIQTLGLKTLYPRLATDAPPDPISLEKAIRKFRKNFYAQPVKRSNVIEVCFQHRDPQVAARTVNVFVDFFREKHLQVYSGPKSSFLESQLRRFEGNLKHAADRLEAFKQKHGVFSLDEQKSLLLKQQNESAASLAAAENEIHGLEQKRLSLVGKMKAVGEDIPAYTDTEQYRIIDDAKSQLLTLELKEQQLLQKYRETNKFVVDVRKEIELVKEFLQKQEGEIRKTVRTAKNRNELYQALEMDMVRIEADLTAQRARAANTEQQLRQLEREVKALDLREKELQALQRQLASSEVNYKTYLTKVEEARISENMDLQKMANVRVIHPAAVPGKPVKPRKALNIGLSLVLGALLAVGLAFFSEFTGQQLSTPRAVEKALKLPVLTSVGRYNGVVPKLEEGMIDLYETIDALSGRRDPRIIQFMSSVKGEGTSTLVQKFAEVLATKFRRSVLLLDTTDHLQAERPFFVDVRQGESSDEGINPEPLVENHFYPVANTGLHLGILSRSEEAFPFYSDSRKVKHLWKSLQERFDFIVIDSPAAREAPEGLMIARKVDGVVLVVEADSTRWPVVANVRDTIAKRGGKLLGVVLNKRQYHIPDWIYRRI